MVRRFVAESVGFGEKPRMSLSAPVVSANSFHAFVLNESQKQRLNLHNFKISNVEENWTEMKA